MSTPYCPELHPTWDEFNDFEAYMTKIENEYGACGIVKIVAPAGFKPRKNYDKVDFRLTNPVRQTIRGLSGIYEVVQVSAKPMSLKEYKLQAVANDSATDDLTAEQVERLFWKQIRYNPQIYGADSNVSTLFDPTYPWNLANLDTILERGLAPQKLPGVNLPFVYVGSWKTMFAWHKEDFDLYAANYLHFGKPKFWYGIIPAHAARFEALVQSHFHDSYRYCPQYLRHKCVMISPTVLRHHGIKVVKAVQNPGEFIIAFANAYHAGFNLGYNCAEAVNFALPSWLELGRKAQRCQCEADSVYIDMATFEGNLSRDQRKPESPGPKKRKRSS